MTWAGKRKFMLWSVALFVLAVLGYFSFVKLFEREPTCFDGVKNQNELGVDCAGACERLCAFQTVSPTVHWSRSFKVTEGVYNAVAYIENPNFDAGVDTVEYVFQLFDKGGAFLAERQGTTFLSTNAIIPVFEGGIETGERVPARTFFEFTAPFNWRGANNLPGIRVRNAGIRNVETTPRIDAVLANESVADVFDIEVVAVVFDEGDNAVGSSKTLVRLLEGGKETPIVFTWPASFGVVPARIEVVPRVPLQ